MRPASRAKSFIQQTCHRLGYDISRWPAPSDFDKHLLELLLGLSINCVLDVGAHWGEYASQLRKLGYRGRMVSFEPSLQNFERLKEVAKDDSNWLVRQHALGRVREMRELGVPVATNFSSFLEPSDFGLKNPDQIIERRELVQVLRLDEVLGECLTGISEPHVYLKTDTQGYDLEVLAGACLDDVLGLQSEVSVKPIYKGMPTYLQALDYIQRLGFELTGLFPISRDNLSQIIEFDAVFRRANTMTKSL